ncbi:hypothetical protein LOC68_26340 [Blastopirellula sp. JC732]|uniref:THUMP-like domain-containing protein n=1 Tax=Blastopirellula sediminis TaxID=2894196 RepID=A0A9X1SI54_9BACT|nr:class I SAM-dependent methyltransferase [Blastopirellula sediminis]MCC9604771.1 hypothetical protein [Blastopirellula sediminis]MCC9631930.1 hypothetical protein [Blastopirellula sediminis]
MSAESADLTDLHWLTSAEAAEIFAQQSQTQLSVAQLSQLNREAGPARATLISEQLELRQRGKAKFSRAGEMFFTRVGLEQATDEVIAAYKAKRFSTTAKVADLCCGVGGDLIAAAEGRSAVGVDLSPQLALIAGANCAAYGRSVATQSVDAASVDIATFDAWHCDPDRRAADRRTTQLDSFSPTTEQLAALLDQNPNAAIKLAPATQVPQQWRDGAELEWISSRRECRQLIAWFGALAGKSTGRRATHIDRDGAVSTFVSAGDASLQVAAKVGDYVMEPDPALLAANLVDHFAAQHQLGRLLPRSVYLTGDAPIDSALVATFQVREQLPIDRKSLSKKLQEQGIGRVELKVRGLDIRPEEFLKKLRLSGDKAATVILTPTPSGNRAILCERI